MVIPCWLLLDGLTLIHVVGCCHFRNEERTVEISIIVIAALIIFFLLIAWCGFLFGLYRNRKFAKEMKMVEQNHQLRQQRWKQMKQQRKQQLLEQQQQLQQQQQQQQQRQQQQQIIRPMLHPPPSQCSHSRQSSYNSGMSTPSAPPLPLAVPPRDYPDYSPSLNASVSSGIGYQSRGAFDHLQGYSSPEHSFINPGYKSAASPQDHSPFHSGYSPVPPRSTSTPATKVANKDVCSFSYVFFLQKPCKTSKPSNPAYNMEMHQYSQLQNWPQNY